VIQTEYTYWDFPALMQQLQPAAPS
jgi:hypothetical protein